MIYYLIASILIAVTALFARTKRAVLAAALDGEREEDGLYDATVHDLKWRFRLWPQRY